MKIVSIIHARGGSKRIPLKNIQLLAGKPLLWYPIALARSVPEISRTIVTSDHPEIIRIAKECGAEAPFVRPPDISEDVASELVTLHVLNWLRENEGSLPDIAVTLTPATPFTKPEALRAAIKMLVDHPDWDSVITVRKAKEYPQWMIDIAGDGTGSTPFGHGFDGEYNVSQNLKKYYFPVGAFFVNRISSFLKAPSMYGRSYGCFHMDMDQHLDIDDPEDLAEARKLAGESTAGKEKP
jgi:CMP-N,N'-diacetyllegionaminic acid synthase